MSTIKIKQVRSKINRPIDQKRTLEALGLRKIGHTVEHKLTPSIVGKNLTNAALNAIFRASTGPSPSPTADVVSPFTFNFIDAFEIHDSSLLLFSTTTLNPSNSKKFLCSFNTFLIRNLNQASDAS